MSTPSLLTIGLRTETLNGFSNTAAEATININKTINPQTIILRGYQVQCTSASYAFSQGEVYVDLPFLGGYCLTDGITYMSRLPLLLNYDQCTLFTEMTTPLRLSGPIPAQFVAKVYNRDGTLVDPSSILSVFLQFSYGTDAIQGS